MAHSPLSVMRGHCRASGGGTGWPCCLLAQEGFTWARSRQRRSDWFGTPDQVPLGEVHPKRLEESLCLLVFDSLSNCLTSKSLREVHNCLHHVLVSGTRDKV